MIRLPMIMVMNKLVTMANEITDEMLEVLVPAAPFEKVAALLLERYAGVAQGISLRMPKDPAQDAAFAGVVAALQRG